MKTKRFHTAFAVAAAGVFGLSACGTDVNVPPGGGNPALDDIHVECGEETVSAEGSSAQKNAMDLVTRDYSLKCPGEQLNYTKSGSGKGISAFTAGQIDFGGSDAPLDEAETQEAAQRCGGNEPWNIPMVIGPIAMSYNLPGDPQLTLTPDVISQMYQGEITNWNDPAIAELNPDEQLPDMRITPFFRSDESGTTENFQQYLDTATDGGWQGEGKQFGDGDTVGQGRDGSDQVVQSVDGTPGGITYAEWAFPKNLGLGIADLDSGSGPVDLNTDTVGRAVEAANIEGEGHDLQLDLDSIYGTSEPGAYPLLLNTYEIVCSDGYEPETAQAVKAALTVAAHSDPEQLEEAGYVPLPEQLKQQVLDSVDAINS